MTPLSYGQKLARDLKVKQFREYFDWQYSDSWDANDPILFEFYFHIITKQIIEELNKHNINYHITSGCHDKDKQGLYKTCVIITVYNLKNKKI